MPGIPAQQAQPSPELMAKIGEELKTLHPFCSILWQRLFELETFGRRFPPFAVSVCGWTQHHHAEPLSCNKDNWLVTAVSIQDCPHF